MGHYFNICISSLPSDFSDWIKQYIIIGKFSTLFIKNLMQVTILILICNTGTSFTQIHRASLLFTYVANVARKKVCSIREDNQFVMQQLAWCHTTDMVLFRTDKSKPIITTKQSRPEDLKKIQCFLTYMNMTRSLNWYSVQNTVSLLIETLQATVVQDKTKWMA